MRTFRFGFPAPGTLALAFALCLGDNGTTIASTTNPVLIGSWPGQGSTFDVTVSGGYAYLAEGNGRLEVIDVSNRAAPRKVGEYECQTNETVFGVIVSPGKLSWEGFGAARLQRATWLPGPDWHDVPGSEATNDLTLPFEGTSPFYRLAKP